MHSINILAIDISYRSTGYALISREKNTHIIHNFGTLDNPQMFLGFNGLKNASKSFNDKTFQRIWQMINESKADIVVVEMPAFTQSAKAALCIGMCWGALSSFIGSDRFCFIEPSVLKSWSESKKGDKKAKVKQKVLDRTNIQSNDDNIIDAVGIALVTSDIISQLKYEANIG